MGALDVDCLIIGAGPAGSVTARGAAEKGLSVLMIEKRPEIGVPVRCGEGISRSTLEMIGLEKHPSFVANEVDGAKIHSPLGRILTLGPEIAGPEVGLVIRRDRFDQELARRAAKAGAEVRVMTEATSFRRDRSRAVVHCRSLKNGFDVTARVVIAADGFESQVARWAGIDTSLPPKDWESCLQYLMEGVQADDRFTEFFMGREVAPGGYLWCFPKGSGMANVGIGINGAHIGSPAEARRFLDSFIMKDPRFKNGRVLRITGGGVSVSLPVERTFADNLLIVGDAARMIDPLTGGGIYNACFAALKAAQTVSEAVEGGDCSEAGLSSYEGRWRAGLESEMARDYLAKEKLLELPDRTLDRVIEAISTYDLKELSTGELLKAISKRDPELIRELVGT